MQRKTLVSNTAKFWLHSQRTNRQETEKKAENNKKKLYYQYNIIY